MYSDILYFLLNHILKHVALACYLHQVLIAARAHYLLIFYHANVSNQCKTFCPVKYEFISFIMNSM